DAAPGLLAEVRNGRGGVVRFHYARSTDRSVVELNSNRPSYAAKWNDWIAPSLPVNTWVVKATEISSDAGATFARTDYRYAAPVSGPEFLPFAPDGIHVLSGSSPRLHVNAVGCKRQEFRARDRIGVAIVGAREGSAGIGRY